MNSTVGLIVLSLFLVGLIWIAISVASEDGFFTSLCTVVVLFCAYQFARLEWGFFVQFLRAGGMTDLQAISTGYWLGFLIIVAPGIVVARLLARPKVPFPYPLEKYGSILIGACAGILLFAALIQWFYHFDFLRQAFMIPLRTFSPIFQILGYRSEGFGE